MRGPEQFRHDNLAREKLTPKQEAFVLAYYQTGNACEAYRQAYDAANMSLASVDKEARRLLKDPRIAPRLQGLAVRSEGEAQLSLAEHMEELRVLRELAKERGHISAAIAAEVKRGELRRFYVKQIESAPPNPFADLSDEELDEFIRTEAAEVLPALQERKAPARRMRH
jgi:phage terminase small subunit